MPMTASVVIATYNRAALLDECLQHVARQGFVPGDEVIVVDNGSTDGTAAVIERHAADYPVPLRRLRELQPGKSRAIGRALEVATGEVLAFTDDDVNVDHEWLSALRSAMADERVALVGGPVWPRWEGERPRWLRLTDPLYAARFATPLAVVDYGSVAVELGRRTAMGGNLAVRRDVMQRLGGFAPHLGKLRGTLMSGEDDDLCRRVQAAGYRAMYCPEAHVHHWVPTRRVRIRYFISWFFWWGITNAALDESASSQTPGRLRLSVHFAGRFVSGALSTLLWTLRGRVSAAMHSALDASYAVGYLARRSRLITIGQPQDAAPTAKTWARKAV